MPLKCPRQEPLDCCSLLPLSLPQPAAEKNLLIIGHPDLPRGRFVSGVKSRRMSITPLAVINLMEIFIKRLS